MPTGDYPLGGGFCMHIEGVTCSNCAPSLYPRFDPGYFGVGNIGSDHETMQMILAALTAQTAELNKTREEIAALREEVGSLRRRLL